MIYLLRHGNIGQGEEKRFVGQTDRPLNEEGLDQARLWQQKLKTQAFDKIYSSDLSRAHQTALIIAGGHQGEVQPLAGLREIDLGEWEGLSIDEAQARFPEAWQRREEDLPTFRPPGGESFRDLAARIAPVFDRMVHGLEADILIVAHAGVNRVILCRILGMDLANLFRIRQDYGCLNLIERNREDWRVAAMNIPVNPHVTFF